MPVTVYETSSKFSTRLNLLLLLFMYDAGMAARIDDPEPEVTWTPPSDGDFKYFKVGANYSGLLYAGTVEFNWIVDIRIEDTDQEEWATGNLVSFYHVLTTCTAVNQLQRQSETDLRDAVQEKDFPRWTVDVYRYSPTLIRIHYCQNYLWTDGGFVFQNYDRQTSGGRSVKKIIRHPDCKRNTLQYDAAIIVMDRPVPSLEPRLGYMPTGYDYVNEKVKEMVVLNPDEPITYASPLCYVASFGRHYVNHAEFYVLDYKVKYRVYISKWKECSDVWDYVCSKDGDVQCADESVKQSGRKYLMCLRPRAKVGTVCDHDKGAPLVCNGQVIGLVIRGPKYQYCNNLYKIPFIVEKLDHYREFYDDSVKYAVQPVPRKEDTTTKAPALTPTPFNSASALVALKILHIAVACYYIQVQKIL